MTLYPDLPSIFTRTQETNHSTLRKALKNSPLAPALLEAREWLAFVRALPTARRVCRVLASACYDLVHVNNSFTYQVPTLVAAKVAHIPVVAHIRNPQRPGPFSEATMRLANCIVSVSRFHEKQLKSWGLSVPVTTCYDGVELPLPDQSSSSQLRASLLAGGETLIGSVGRLDKQKGYEDLIVAARRVADMHPGARFVIAGEGPLRPRLEQLIADLKLETRFRVCGFRADVANFLGAVDVYVCSSRWEGLPLALVEAMLLKKPVVATNVGGNSEVVLPERTGKLVPPGGPGSSGSRDPSHNGSRRGGTPASNPCS